MLPVIPVFQVALITALSAAVLVATLLWSARQRRGLTVPHEARRVLVALERASWASIRRCALRLPWPIGGVFAVLVVAYLVLAPKTNHAPLVFVLAGGSASLVLGVFASLLMAYLCGHHGRKHAFLGVSAAPFSINRSLTVAISSASVLVIGAEVAGMLAVIALHGLLGLLARGAIEATLPPAAASRIAAMVAPYFAIGSTIAALSLQQTGVACIGAASLTGVSGFEARTGLSSHDPRNPTVLVAAVARQLGGINPRILDAFISGALLATLSLQLSSIAPSQAWPTGAASVGMLPVMLRGFGLLASLVGLLTIRTNEHEDLRSAFLRGQLVAHAVLASAIAGLVLWLAGEISFPVATAGFVGMGLSAGLGHLGSLLAKRGRPARSAIDDVAGQSLVATVDAGATGLRTVLAPVLVYALAVGLFTLWFEHAQITRLEQATAILVGMSVPAALTAWGLVIVTSRDLGAVGALSSSVGRIPLTDEAMLRLRRLAESTERASSSTLPSLGDSGALLCALAAVVGFASHDFASTRALAPTSGFALSLWVLLPIVLAGFETFKTSAKTARTQSSELERQLRGMRRQGAQILVPEDFVPSYRSCIELLARDSAQGGQIFAVAAIALPILAARLATASENTPGSVALSLAFYAAIAAAAGLFTVNVGHAAVAAASLANRGSQSLGVPQSGPPVSVSEPARLVEFIGHSLSASVPLLTKAVALVTLAMSAMLGS